MTDFRRAPNGKCPDISASGNRNPVRSGIEPLLQRLDPITPHPVRFRFNRDLIPANPGDTVAAALLAAGVRYIRHAPVGGDPRLPYCMMGICFECLVTIDGCAEQQACLTVVTDGMQVESGTPS